jgi:hypothetical protein
VIDASEVVGAVCSISTFGLLAEVVVVAVLNPGTVLLVTTSSLGEPGTITALPWIEFAPSIAQDATGGAFGCRALSF